VAFFCFCLQVFAFTAFIWGLYSLAVVLLFVVIKVINYRLHVMYDTGVAVEEPELEDVGDHCESQDNVDVTNGRSGETLGETIDGEHSR